MSGSYHSDSSNLNLKNNLYAPEPPQTKRVTAKQNKTRLEKEKPGRVTQAFCDSGAQTPKSDVIPHPIIADAAPESSLRKNLIGKDRMSVSHGYLRIPRSLLDDPYYDDASVIHKQILLTIIKLACWRPQEFNDKGNIVKLEIGQVCISVRELAKKSGKGITKNHVQGALKYFENAGKVRHKVRQFLRHEVRHSKSIITITHMETYNLMQNSGQTTHQTKFSQEKTTNKELKELKDVVNAREPAIFSESEKSGGENAPNPESVSIRADGRPPNTKETVYLTKPDGTHYAVTRSDLFSFALTKDWTPVEVGVAFETMTSYGGRILDWQAYISGIIKNQRLNDDERYNPKAKRTLQKGGKKTNYPEGEVPAYIKPRDPAKVKPISPELRESIRKRRAEADARNEEYLKQNLRRSKP